MDTLCLGFLYFGNSLRSIARGFGCFFKALKMVFGVRSIRVFSKFSLDPYYEPLPRPVASNFSGGVLFEENMDLILQQSRCRSS